MKVVVFLGPSLPVETARRHLPAIFLPPVAQGDLVSAVQRHRPDAVAIIDGVFGQSLSVWHKEILWALDQGIMVFGAASMGALRAVETAPFGMIGVGRIHQMYVDGEIEDDDEVAVLHGLPEEGHRPLTTPMVNLRITLELAVREGVIDEAERAQVTALAKSICFEERTLSAVFARAREELPGDALERVRGFVSTRLVDQKALDAVELLQLLGTLERPAAMPARADFTGSHLFNVMYQRDRKASGGAGAIAVSDVAAQAATQLADFDHLNRSALNRGLALHFCDLVQLEVSEADVDAELAGFQQKHALERRPALDAWLTANDLDEAELRSLMREEARCRALRRWLLTIRYKLRGVKLLLDELRLQGRYAGVKQQVVDADRAARAASPRYDSTAERDDALLGLLREQFLSTGLRVTGDPREWLRETGFLSWTDVETSLLRARFGRDAVILSPG